MSEALLNLAERPIMHPDNVLPQNEQHELTGIASAHEALARLDDAAEARVSEQLARGVGVTAPLPGYEYLHQYGQAVGDFGPQPEDESIVTDLLRATPEQAVRLGVHTAAAALETTVTRYAAYVPGVVADKTGEVARAIVKDGAAAYRPADRAAAVSNAVHLAEHLDVRDERGKELVAAFMAEKREHLTNAEVAASAAEFWDRSGFFDNAADEDAVEALDAQPPIDEQEEVKPLEERLAQQVSAFAGKVVAGVHVEATELATSTPVDHFRRGAVKAMAYVALATKEFGVQAGVPEAPEPTSAA